VRQGTDGRRDCATAYCSRTEVGGITAYSLGSCAMGQTDGRIVVLPNNNNNNSHDNVYGAVIMTKVIARVHTVHVMNVD